MANLLAYPCEETVLCQMTGLPVSVYLCRLEQTSSAGRKYPCLMQIGPLGLRSSVKPGRENLRFLSISSLRMFGVVYLGLSLTRTDLWLSGSCSSPPLRRRNGSSSLRP